MRWRYKIAAIGAALALAGGLSFEVTGPANASSKPLADQYMPGYVNGGPLRHRVLVRPDTDGDPSGWIDLYGNLCVFDSDNDVGYCVNDTSGNEDDGNSMLTYQREASGEPHNDWAMFVVGTVTSSNGGWPWPNTLLMPGDGSVTLDDYWNNVDIWQLAYYPSDNFQNYCAVEYVDDTSTGVGTINGYTCDDNDPPTSLDQLWLLTNYGQVVNVRGTYDDIVNNNDYDIIQMAAGNFGNGYEIYAAQGNSTSAFQVWEWYSCWDDNCPGSP